MLNKILQPNASNFKYEEIHIEYFVFRFFYNFTFSLMNAFVFVDIEQGNHKGKSKVARNEKQNKKLRGFSNTYIKYSKF